MRKSVLLFVCAILSISADDLKEKTNELDEFQGFWKATKATISGMEVDPKALGPLDFTIKGNQATPKQNPTDIATINVKSAKMRGEIDFVDKDKKVDKGIFRFVDKDTLELCVQMDEGDRPKEFASPKDSKVVWIVLKRSKE